MYSQFGRFFPNDPFVRYSYFRGKTTARIARAKTESSLDSFPKKKRSAQHQKSTMATLEIDYSLLPVDSKAQINVNGGVYNKGVALPLERKMLVASLYRNHQNSAAPNRRPNISKIAAEAKVSEHFVRKVEQELLTYGNVVDPKAVKTDARSGLGLGE